MKKTLKYFVLFIIVAFMLLLNISNIFFISANDNVSEKVKPTLKRIYENMDEKSTVPVWIWLDDTDISTAINNALESMDMSKEKFYLSIENSEMVPDELTSEIVSDELTNEYLSTKRSITRELNIKRNTNFACEYFNEDEIIYISQYTPVIIVNMSEEKASQLIHSKDVNFIDYFDNTCTPEITNSRQLIRITSLPTSTLNGTGVKIGVFDVGNVDTGKAVFSGVSITRRYTTTQCAVDEHPTRVTAIIANIAPKATYYTTSTISTTNYINEIEWLVTQGVTVINASLAIGGDGTNTYGTVAQWIDSLCYNSDVTFVKSAGNSGSSGVTSGGMSYNGMAIGNYDYNGTLTNFSDDIINTSSSYYSLSSLAFKPDISAPGTNIASAGYSASSGTSFSAPHVVGTVALLMQKDSLLKTDSETVKAILTAGVNMSTSHHYVPANRSSSGNNYMKFGAGLLDAYNAYTIVNNSQHIPSFISSSASSKSHTFTVNSADVGKTFRISLAFTKNPSYTLANLDLEICAPAGTVMKLSSTNNNIEICEFTPAIAGAYTINVKKVSAPATSIYYGIAWTKS